MPSLAMQLWVYGLMAGVLLIHAGLVYRLYHRYQEECALPFMGYLLAKCGGGLALVFNVILIQLLFPQFGAFQVLLLSPLLQLPFLALAPFFFVQFALVHLGRRPDWRFNLGYWVAFIGLIIYHVLRNVRQLLHPRPDTLFLYRPLLAPLGSMVALAALGYWAYRLFKAPPTAWRRGSAILASCFLGAFLLQGLISRQGQFRWVGTMEHPAPSASLSAETPPAQAPLSRGTGWARLRIDLVFFWSALPAYWVLRALARHPRPEAQPECGLAMGGAPDLDLAHSLMLGFGLSPRECEVAALVVEGRSNKEIGDLLFISLDTVKRHVSNVFRKTGVKNRVQLARTVAKTP